MNNFFFFIFKIIVDLNFDQYINLNIQLIARMSLSVDVFNVCLCIGVHNRRYFSQSTKFLRLMYSHIKRYSDHVLLKHVLRVANMSRRQHIDSQFEVVEHICLAARIAID